MLVGGLLNEPVQVSKKHSMTALHEENCSENVPSSAPEQHLTLQVAPGSRCGTLLDKLVRTNANGN